MRKCVHDQARVQTVWPFRASTVAFWDCIFVALYVITFHWCFCTFQRLGHLFPHLLRIFFTSWLILINLDSVDHGRHDVTARDKEVFIGWCVLCQAMRASSYTKRRRNIRVHCWAVLLGWKAQRSSCIVGCCRANVEPAIQKQQISSTCPSIRSVSSPSNGISSFSLPLTRGFDMLFHYVGI